MENENRTHEAEERQHTCRRAGYDVDVVKEPSHYRHGTFEVIDEMLLAFGPQRTYDFCILNAWKYRSRAPYKGKTEQDMAKADRYMDMAGQILKKNGHNFCMGVPQLIKTDLYEESNGAPICSTNREKRDEFGK